MPEVALNYEISFLQHRLEVVELWPDSPRKSATRHAICVRLETLGIAPGPSIEAKHKAKGAAA